MLTNTISRNEKLRTQMSQNAEFSQLFSNVLNQLLGQENTNLIVQESMNLQPKTLAYPSSPGAPSISFTELANPTENFKSTLPLGSTTAAQIDQVLSGRLAGMGSVFVAAGQMYEIDSALLAAIAQHETGNGKSKAAVEKNNIAGMMGKNGLKTYATVEDSIMDMARNLSQNYLDKGLKTITKIGAKYAPIGATNDPTGLNNYWVKGVTKYYDRINIG